MTPNPSESMPPDRATPPPAPSPTRQLVARSVLAIAVVAVGLWVLFDFLPALAWAVVLAIALWPGYSRLLRWLPPHSDRVLGPLLVTTGIAVVIIAPLVLLGVAIVHESHVVIGFVAEARHYGLPVPFWVESLPLEIGRASCRER